MLIGLTSIEDFVECTGIHKQKHNGVTVTQFVLQPFTLLSIQTSSWLNWSRHLQLAVNSDLPVELGAYTGRIALH